MKTEQQRGPAEQAGDSGNKTVKTTAIAVAMGLIVAMMSWRQGKLEDELSGLRASAEKARSQRAPAALAQSPKSVESSGVAMAPAPAAAAGGLAKGASRDRLGEIEGVVDGQADVMETVLARFAEWDERERTVAKRKQLETYLTYERAMSDALVSADKSQPKGLKYRMTIGGQTGTSKEARDLESAQRRLTEAITILKQRGDEAVLMENGGRSSKARSVLVVPDSAPPEAAGQARSTLRREK